MSNFPDLTKSYNLSEGHAICRSVICLFLTLWFIGCHKAMKFSLETERKTVDIFTDCLKTDIKFSLGCAKSAKCDADVEVSPCSLKNTSLTFSILYSIYILIHRSSDISPLSETSRKKIRVKTIHAQMIAATFSRFMSMKAEIRHSQMNMTIFSRFILFLREMSYSYFFVQSLPFRQSK